MRFLFKLTILLFAITSFGQESTKVDFGIEGGVNFASIRGAEHLRNNYSAISNLTGGLFTQYNFKNKFALKTGVYLEQKGGSYDFITIVSQIQAKGRNELKYTTIPLLLKANFGNKFKYFINAGPYVSILNSATHISESPFSEK